MQIICHFAGTARDYIEQGGHTFFTVPARCPNCRCAGKFHSHGCYTRNVAGIGIDKYDGIKIRRFRCYGCGRTVSLLPSCLQPYRLIENRLIAGYFSKNNNTVCADWDWLLKSYWRRFDRWSLRLLAPMGRSPPPDARKRWRVMTRMRNGLDSTTLFMTQHCRFTLFGKYRCHWPGRTARNFPTEQIYSPRTKNGRAFALAYETSRKKFARR